LAGQFQNNAVVLFKKQKDKFEKKSKNNPKHHHFK
jgi:hypothetical protein